MAKKSTISSSDARLTDFFSQLSSSNSSTRLNGATALKDFIEIESRIGASMGHHVSWLELVRERLGVLANSTKSEDRFGCVAAIDKMVEVCEQDTEDTRKYILFFHTYINNILHAATEEIELAKEAARTLGKVIRSAGSIASRLLEEDVGFACNLTKRGKNDQRLIAVLVLEQLAVNAPTLFFRHVNDFFHHIFDVLWDEHVEVRVAAEQALYACFLLLDARKMIAHSNGRDDSDHWYKIAYNRAVLDLRQNKSDLRCHAGFVMLRALSKQGGSFMLQFFDDVFDILQRFCKCKTKVVRLSVLQVLAPLSQFCSLGKLEEYLLMCINLIVREVAAKLPVAFESLGDLVFTCNSYFEATAMDVFKSQKENLLKVLKTGLSPSHFCDAYLSCMANIASALGREPSLKAFYNKKMVDKLFQGGLQPHLALSLEKLVNVYPELKNDVEILLLQNISLVLMGESGDPGDNVRDHSSSGTVSPTSMGAFSMLRRTLSKLAGTEAKAGISAKHDPILVNRALRFLHVYNFSGISGIIEFVRTGIVKYMDHVDPDVRTMAAVSCIKLVASTSAMRKRMSSDIHSASGMSSESFEIMGVVKQTVERLLLSAVTDASYVVRRNIAKAFSQTIEFDEYMLMPENLDTVISLTRDERLTTRRYGIIILGRLTHLNPPLLLPSLHTIMLRLVENINIASSVSYDADHSAWSGVLVEDSAQLLGDLLRATTVISPVTLPEDHNSLQYRKSERLLLTKKTEQVQRGMSRRSLVMENSRTFNDNSMSNIMAERSNMYSALRTENVNHLVEKENAVDVLFASTGSGVEALSLHTNYVEPYAGMILEALIPHFDLNTKSANFQSARRNSSIETPGVRLTGASGNGTSNRLGEHTVSVSIISLLGELAAIAPSLVASYFKRIIPVLIHSMKTTATLERKMVAVAVLGKIAQCTGQVVLPYTWYPQLFGVLLGLLSTSSAGYTQTDCLERETIRTLGILGAVDPLKSRIEPTKATAQDDAEQCNNIVNSLNIGHDEDIEFEYAKIVLSHLVKMLSDKSLCSRYALQIFRILLEISKVLDPKDISDIMPILVPSICHAYSIVSKTATDAILVKHEGVELLRQLIYLTGSRIADGGFLSTLHCLCVSEIKIARGDTQNWASENAYMFKLLDLVSFAACALKPKSNPIEKGDEYASGSSSEDLSFGEKNAVGGKPSKAAGGNSDSTTYDSQPFFQIQDLVPCLLRTLRLVEDRVSHKALIKILVALQQFGNTLEEYLPDIIPAVCRLIDREEPDLREMALMTIEIICSEMQLKFGAALIVNGVTRLADRVLNTGVFDDAEIQRQHEQIVSVLCSVAWSQESAFAMHIPSATAALNKLQISDSLKSSFNDMIEAILTGNNLHPPPLILSGAPGGGPGRVVFVCADDSYVPLEQNFTFDDALVVQAGEIQDNTTPDDWEEWIKKLSLVVLQNSPSVCLRLCHMLAVDYSPLALELFNDSFFAVWRELEFYPNRKNFKLGTLFDKLEYNRAKVPVKILQILLNMVQHIERKLGLESVGADVGTLGNVAKMSQSFAKAVWYKEIEFRTNPANCALDLMSINRQLGVPEGAQGVLQTTVTHPYYSIDVHVSWYEMLEQWEKALVLYEENLDDDMMIIGSKEYYDCTLGKLNCMLKQGKWVEMESDLDKVWTALTAVNGGIFASKKRAMHSSFRNPASFKEELKMRKRLEKFAIVGATAAWSMTKWDGLDEFVSKIPIDSFLGSFYRAVIGTKLNDLQFGQMFVDSAAKILVRNVKKMASKTYDSCYQYILQAQQLTELEEIIRFKGFQMDVHAVCDGHSANDILRKRQESMFGAWRNRLAAALQHVDVFTPILAVHSLLEPEREQLDTWLKYSRLALKDGRHSLSMKVLQALGINSSSIAGLCGTKLNPSRASSPTLLPPHESDVEALSFLRNIGMLPQSSILHPRVGLAYLIHLWDKGIGAEVVTMLEGLLQTVLRTDGVLQEAVDNTLLHDCYLKLGKWRRHLAGDELDPHKIKTMLEPFCRATEELPSGSRAWHEWGEANFSSVQYYLSCEKDRHVLDAETSASLETCLSAAIEGYFHSINHNKLGETRLQDTLRLLTLWFSHGTRPSIKSLFDKRIDELDVNTWLQVLPQLIARIQLDRRSGVTAENWPMIGALLYRVGLKHPQALVYPLTVAANSSSKRRKDAASDVLRKLRMHNSKLFDQAEQVSLELLRVAVLWHETWHDALDEACRKFFTEHDLNGMIDVIEPLQLLLNNAMENGVSSNGEPLSLREISFICTFGRDLQEAWEWCKCYQNSSNVSAIYQAWDLYYTVYKGLKKNMTGFTKLELKTASFWLFHARNLEIAVPGTYMGNEGELAVKIVSFLPTLDVMVSKCKPRRMRILGSDGKEYMFLLKGTEDLRQDERVMQLFGLVNASLLKDKETHRKQFSIRRFSVVPLSSEGGLVGWVHNCDTLHGLIKDYRDSKGINMMLEHSLMVREACDGRALDQSKFDRLTVPQKIEAFEYALSQTRGQDLHNVLWLKSPNAEEWHLRRTKYTNSLAVMSMVGHILGLGDRHPSNFLLERHTGQIVHIDFGDCFEVAMDRERFPEKVPFRLTRMLVNAMAVSGVEGTFRVTCEAVMRVLRENQNSLMIMLDAFVHDPLVSWKFDGEREDDVEVASFVLDEEEESEVEEQGRVRRASKAVASMAKMVIGKIGKKANKHADSAVLPSIAGGKRLRVRTISVAEDMEGDEKLNDRAIDVIKRVRDKLTGMENGGSIREKVASQVSRLIDEARSSENLCQMWTGWGAFF